MNNGGSAFDGGAGGDCVDSSSHGDSDNDGDDGGNVDRDHNERKGKDGSVDGDDTALLLAGMIVRMTMEAIVMVLMIRMVTTVMMVAVVRWYWWWR